MAISRVPDDWVKKFTKMKLNMPASGMKNQINLLLCGPPGNGKSSTGNSIVNKNKKDKDRFEDDSETTCISWGATVFQNYKLKVFDCPPAPREKTTNENKITKISGNVMPNLLKLSPQGFHSVLVVVKYGNRLYQEEEFVVPLIKRMFGEDFIENHAICVVTNGDMFRKVSQGSQAGQDFHSWCKEQKADSALGKIFQTCCYRCVLFDNFTEDSRIRTEQVGQLMSMVTETWPRIVTIKATISVSPTMRIKADIHVLIESAASQLEFQQQLEFALKYNASFKTDSKMSVLIVGTTKHIKIDQSEYNNGQEFTKALMSIPYLEPCESTDNALALSRQESFTTTAYRGEENKQLLVMVTQGVFKDEEKATQEADQLKSSGTQIMVVAVASVSRQMVASLASDQDSVFVADNYDELPDVALEAATKTVEKLPYYELVGDVLFILDSSGSISPEDYQRELDFVLELINDFNIGPTAVQFSVMIYSSQPVMRFRFSDFSNHEQIRQAIRTAPHFKQSTDTAAALDLARTTAFDVSSGARETGKKIAVLITDGHSDDRPSTARAAEKLTNSGVLTLAVGVGDNVDRSELILIAHSSEEVYMVGDFRLLQTIKDEIADKTDRLRNVTRRSANTAASPHFQQDELPPLLNLLGSMLFGHK